MKAILKTLLVCLVFSQLQAQKTFEKTIDFNSEKILAEFKFADDIEVKTWNKKQVYIKAEVDINGGEYTDYFSLKVDNSSSVLQIESDYGELFNLWKREKGSSKKNNWDPCNNLNIDAKYTVYVPANSSFRIKSISGNVTSQDFNGQLQVDIISGNIDIKNYNGNLDLKTVSGDIDINIAKSRLKAETVTGMIYSDKDMEFDQGKNRIVGSKVTGSFGDVKNDLELKTVSGDIFIRKQ